MRRLVFFLPVAILFLLLSSLPSWGGAENAGPIRIGVLAPLSGPFASGGSAFIQAVSMAAEQANADGGVLGRHVDLVVADTQGVSCDTRPRDGDLTRR